MAYGGWSVSPPKKQRWQKMPGVKDIHITPAYQEWSTSPPPPLDNNTR